MNTLTAALTVGRIAAENPASTRVFEKYGIDFCCGGRTGFAEACAARGLNPETVLGELEAAAAGSAENRTDWQTAPIGLLIDHILGTHHVYLKRELPRLAAMLEKVEAAHGSAVPAIAEVLGPMTAELEAHLMKEEIVLFPLIRGGRPGAMGPIRVMLAEHDAAGEALAQLRSLTGGYRTPAEACNTWRALYAGLGELERDLHQHINLENNVLFPRALGEQ